MTGAPKVVYVLGFGRSGSTLLDLVIGSRDGWFSGGELQSLWHESLLDGRRCGCGVLVGSCPLWTEIIGGPTCSALGATPEQMATMQACLLAADDDAEAAPTSSCDPSWRRYVEVVGRLYERIAAVTGAGVVVDSSKVPSVAAALHARRAVELFPVQLVRDPRAVAWSWMRRKPATDRSRRAEMLRLSSAASARTWVQRQLAAEQVRSLDPSRSLLVRYEDLVADPAGTVRAVDELVDGPRPGPIGPHPRAVHLRPNHTVSGNPLRLRSGCLDVCADREWETCLPDADREAVTRLTRPLLERYGYA